MIGNIPELYDPESVSGSYPSHIGESDPPPSIKNRQIYIPLDFWFCRKSGKSLPLIALQNNTVEIEVTFRPIFDLYTVVETEDKILLSLGKSVTISKQSQNTAIRKF